MGQAIHKLVQGVQTGLVRLVNIVYGQDDRAGSSRLTQQHLEHCHQLSAAHTLGHVAILCRRRPQAQHLFQQRRGKPASPGIRPIAEKAEEGLPPGVIRRIGLQSQPLSQQGAEECRRFAAQVRRTTHANPAHRLDSLLKGLHQPRFANTSLADQSNHVALAPIPAAFPIAQQRAQLTFTAHKGSLRQATRCLN